MMKTLGHLGSTRLRPAAALAALCLLLPGALPAAAAAPGDGEDKPTQVKDRRMIVVSADDAERPRVLLRSGGGYLGVELTALTPELRAHFGVPADRGVMVARIEDDSPAARAGLQVGDVIAEIDGEAIESTWDLGAAVRSHEAGEEADLRVWRDGRALDFRVTLDERKRAQVDLGRVLEWKSGDGPRVFEWRSEDGAGDLPTLYFEPESIERLHEAVERMDWSRFGPQGLAERNRELEQRLEELEERLRELEEALRRSER